MLDVSEYSSPTLSLSKMKKKLKNKRRFSDEQIRSLEFTFGSETKLDPGKKAKLAKELGLQPRQVSIWFQNKRARWKSKQIEKDYSVLLEDYNNLASKFEDLKKEKQAFLIQLQKLKNEVVGKSENEHHECQVQDCAGKSGHITATTDAESYNDAKIDFELLNDLPSKCLELILEEESDDLMKMVEPAADSSLTSHEEENWGGDDIMHHANGSYQWWDFWS